MQRTSTTQAYDNDQREVLPIILGGSGVTTANDAPQALGGVNTQSRGQPDGLATLDRNSKIPPEQFEFLPGTEMPSIDGSNQIYTFTNFIFTITNFDSQTSYTVNANHGNVTRIDDQITYHAPAAPCIDVLQVNNNVIGISVINSYHETPTIAFPANNASNVSLYPVIQLDPINWVGYQDTPAAIEWEITEQGETPIVETKIDHQLHYTPSYALTLNTTYTVRARVSGMLTGTGEWSAAVTFTTTSVALPTTEVDQLHAFPETGGTSAFGQTALAVSSDAQVIVTSDSGFYFNTASQPAKPPGRIFIYSYENNEWIKNAIDSGIVDDSIVGQGTHKFGFNVALSANKQRILVLSAYNPALPITDWLSDAIGDIRIYETDTPNDYSSMSLIAHYPGTTLDVPNKTYQGLQTELATTANFETIVHGVQYDDQPNGQTGETRNTYCVRVLNFDGVDTITLDTEIQRQIPDTAIPITDGYYAFGERLSLSNNGLIICTSSTKRVNNLNGSGSINIFEKINNVWTETHTLEGDDNELAAEYGFGYPVALSNNQLKLATFSSMNSDNTGNVYLFEKINNVWTKTKKLDIPEMQESQLGGAASKFCFNSSDTLLLMSSPWQSTPASSLINGSNDATGMCYLFDVSTEEITISNIYTASDASNGIDGEEYGEMIAFSHDNSTIVITAPWRDWASNGLNPGTIYVYK